MKKFALFTDIDGTLLNNSSSLSKQNFLALKKLKFTYRIAVTGRNLFSAQKVLSVDTPIDYLIFSNGSGIMDWKKQKIIFSQNLSTDKTLAVSQLLIQNKITFTVHKPIPQTHYYFFHIGSYIPSDLPARNILYKPFVKPFSHWQPQPSTCIICMLPKHPSTFLWLMEKLSVFNGKISTTRTSSPFNHENIWIEIYEQNINKGQTAKYLCSLLDIPEQNTIGIGNDYNDESLLNFVAKPFVVANAPDELKKIFPSTVSNQDHAIAEIINLLKLK